MIFLIQYLVIWIVLLLPNAPVKQGQQHDLETAVIANFEELNAVRQNPQAFAAKYKVPALRHVSKKHTLIWDKTLAQLAQQKAEDMAKNNYMEHVDKQGKGMNYYLWQANYPLPHFFSRDPRANNVESIAAYTETPMAFVLQLVVDAGVPSLGHRKHLLGMSDGKYPATHVGVGIAYNANSKYKYYCSILIAPKVEKQL